MEFRFIQRLTYSSFYRSILWLNIPKERYVLISLSAFHGNTKTRDSLECLPLYAPVTTDSITRR